MTFGEAHFRLLDNIRRRIRNGDFTERGLARLIGISQPHIHNVLKGTRKFSPEVLDLILNHFDTSLLDLCNEEEIRARARRRRAPQFVWEAAMLGGAIGPNAPWPPAGDLRERFPAPVAIAMHTESTVVARLLRDERMASVLRGCDVAILDVSEEARGILAPDGLYVIERSGEALIRHVRPGSRALYLATADALGRPLDWERLDIPPHRWMDVIRGRVVWLGRERDRHLPAHQRGRLLSDATSR